MTDHDNPLRHDPQTVHVVAVPGGRVAHNPSSPMVTAWWTTAAWACGARAVRQPSFAARRNTSLLVKLDLDIDVLVNVGAEVNKR